MKTELEKLKETIDSLPLDGCLEHEGVFRLLVSSCERKRDEVYTYKKKSQENQLDKLKTEIKYQAAVESTRTYDDKSEDEHEMSVAENGSCEFSSEEQVALFLKLVRNRDNAYYYHHHVNWSGAGKYIITPETDQDHDCEYIFRYRYNKAE